MVAVASRYKPPRRTAPHRTAPHRKPHRNASTIYQGISNNQSIACTVSKQNTRRGNKWNPVKERDDLRWVVWLP
jgi:hypothetical protein